MVQLKGLSIKKECFFKMSNKTTILIKKEIRDALKKKRKYKRETYDEILARELNLKQILKRLKK